MNIPTGYSNLEAAEWLKILTETRNVAVINGRALLPDLPDEATQRRFVGKAYREAFEQGVSAYSSFLETAKKLDFEIGTETRILDFGCGWGRMSQIAFWKTNPENIFSMDVQDDALKICKETGLRTNLVKISMSPPIQHPDASFDFIMAYSVFSHLNEDLYLQWMKEFARLLRPGGILAITTRGRSIIRYAKELATDPYTPPHARGLAEAFSDWDKAFEACDGGDFVFRAYPSDTPVGAGYGEACIPEGYFNKHWPEYFSDFIYLKETISTGQAIIVGKKGDTKQFT